MCTICNTNKGSDVPEMSEDDLKKIKNVDNKAYIWRGDKKYKSIYAAANKIAHGDKKGIATAKKKIRDSIKNGTVYCGVVWRYGKAMDV
jgi:hypothetical protein